MRLKLTSLILLVVLQASPSLAFAKIHRNPHASAEFKQQQPCPATGKAKGACNGWVIDHINPLACGGADHPSNMQWQTVEDAKAKDKWERKGCTKNSK